MPVPGDQAACRSAQALKAELRALDERKQELELELASWSARLRDAGSDLYSPLIDSEVGGERVLADGQWMGGEGAGKDWRRKMACATCF